MTFFYKRFDKKNAAFFPFNDLLVVNHNRYIRIFLKMMLLILLGSLKKVELKINNKKCNKNMPRPGFEPGLLRPQRSVLTTRRSRRATKEVDTV